MSTISINVNDQIENHHLTSYNSNNYKILDKSEEHPDKNYEKHLAQNSENIDAFLAHEPVNNGDSIPCEEDKRINRFREVVPQVRIQCKLEFIISFLRKTADRYCTLHIYL